MILNINLHFLYLLVYLFVLSIGFTAGHFVLFRHLLRYIQFSKEIILIQKKWRHGDLLLLTWHIRSLVGLSFKLEQSNCYCS